MNILDASGKPIVQEIASVTRDPSHFSYLNVLPELDKIAQSKGAGRGVDYYDSLLTEGVILDKLERRVLGLVSKPWEVTPPTDSAADKEAAELTRQMLETIEFDGLCKELDRDALLKGRAIAEIMWTIKAGLVTPQCIIKRRPGRFVFDTAAQLRLITRENMVEGEPLPPRKFIVHARNATDENPYGVGLGPTLYWYAYFKRRGVSFWLTFADKFGSPTSVGKYPRDAQKTEQDKLLGVLGAIANDSGVIIPEGMEIELLEATRSGIDTYEKLCRYFDELMARTILHEADSARDAGGALKAAQDSRAEVRSDVLQADSDLLTSTLTRDLITPFIAYNMPGAGVPRVWRNFKPDENLRDRIEIDEKLHAMGYRPKDVGYVNETYGGEWVVAERVPSPQEVLAGMIARDKASTKRSPPLQGEGRGGDGSFSERNDAPSERAVQTAITRLADDARPAVAAMVAPIAKLVRESQDYGEVLSGMQALYSELDAAEFAHVMQLATHAAHLAGRFDLRAEAADDIR